MPDLEEQLRAYGSVLDRAEPEVTQLHVLPETRPRKGLLALAAAAAAAAVVIVIAVAAIAVTRDGATRSQVVTPPTTTGDPEKVPAQPPFLAIGDSVLLAASASLSIDVRGFSNIDAAPGRRMTDVPALVRGASPEPRTIVVAVGNDHPITQGGLDALFEVVDGKRVVFVNNRVSRPWGAKNNELLRAMVARSGADVVLVDWQLISEGRPWFLMDDYHLSEEGIHPYASAIAGALGFPTVGTLSVEQSYPFSFFEGRTLIAEAGGDVWIASGTKLERRRPDGDLVATVALPFAYGTDNIAASNAAVWVNGTISDAGPEIGLVRVDVATNKVALALRSPTDDPACVCPIAASDRTVALLDEGLVKRLDPATGKVVNVTTDLRVDVLAVVNDTIYAGGDTGVYAIAPGALPALIPLPRGEPGVRAMTPEPTGEVLVALSTGLTYRIDGRSATQVRDARIVGTAISEGDRLWVAGGDAVSMVDERVTLEFLYDAEARTFRRDPILSQRLEGGFLGMFAIRERLWLVRDSGEVLRVRVGE